MAYNYLITNIWYIQLFYAHTRLIGKVHPSFISPDSNDMHTVYMPMYVQRLGQSCSVW